jgi:ketosteroid isomerase-like protein
MLRSKPVKEKVTMKKQLNQLVVIAIVISFLIAGCSSSAAPVPPTQPPPTQAPTPQGRDPESVLRAITDALNKKDVQAATALLADDVVQTLVPAPSGTGIYKGKEAMRARFKEVVAGNPTHRLTSCQTSGDKVTCAATYNDDSTKPLGFDLEFTVDAVVQNGLLKTVMWTMTPQSLAKMQAAMAPTPTPKPTVALSPEALATKAEDVVGVWLVKLLDNSGEAHLEFTAKGTYTIKGVSGVAQGATIDTGKFKVEGGQLRFEPDGGCLDVQGNSVSPCIGIYQVYVAKQGDKPALLRFVVVEDKANDRKRTFDKKQLPRVEP